MVRPPAGVGVSGPDPHHHPGRPRGPAEGDVVAHRARRCEQKPHTRSSASAIGPGPMAAGASQDGHASVPVATWRASCERRSSWCSDSRSTGSGRSGSPPPSVSRWSATSRSLEAARHPPNVGVTGTSRLGRGGGGDRSDICTPEGGVAVHSLATPAHVRHPPTAEAELMARLDRDEPGARDRLIEHHMPLARRLAARYRHSGESLDDLDAGRLPGPDQGHRPLRPGRRAVPALRGAHHHRRAQAPLPRQGLGHARAARPAGAGHEHRRRRRPPGHRPRPLAHAARRGQVHPAVAGGRARGHGRRQRLHAR